ncbi:hypothetical protein FQA45_10165 [Glutamicibacter halophytocola]|uniref:Uncharacterized protein n=1 Tax=Glutamicibacter halophytocola TaxID=1933880 RepID=A0ABX5YAH3_9MICC|nr:hypothetical protein FQA45_10165 [Glutamicibacter halophytocola]
MFPYDCFEHHRSITSRALCACYRRRRRPEYSSLAPWQGRGRSLSAKEITQLCHDWDTLRDAALAMARSATDRGIRTTLDQAMEIFNLNSAELEAGR